MLQFIGKGSLRLGERVECYFNSKKNMISVRSMDVRNDHYLKIVAYAEYLHLEDVVFSYSATNQRKIFKGIYAGSLPVVPSKDHIVFHDESGFYTTSGIQILGAKFAICYLNMLLAEQPIIKGAERNEPIYQNRVL